MQKDYSLRAGVLNFRIIGVRGLKASATSWQPKAVRQTIAAARRLLMASFLSRSHPAFAISGVGQQILTIGINSNIKRFC